jgi:hypothetical protein
MKKVLITFVALALGAVVGAWAHAQWLLQQAVVEKAAAPTIAPPLPKTGGVNFSYEYVPPRDPALEPAYKRVRDADLLRALPEVQALDGLLLLPRPIHYVTAECGEVNAFHTPGTDEIVVCYETVEVLLERGRAIATEHKLDAAYPEQYLAANLRFILLHETGHALIRLLDLPVTGREEDAVDQLATSLMQKLAPADESPQQVTANLEMASNWFLARSTGQYDLDAYADEHALGEQRYFNLQCLVYGSDPAKFLHLVTEGSLPAPRAERCPEEANRVGRAWLRLLIPHVAPKFEMTEAKANEYFAQKERTRQQHAESAYVR